MFVSENPFNNEVLKSFPFDADYINKVEIAEKSYRKFRNLELNERVKLIKDFRKELFDNLEKLARLISLEMGKPIIQSRAEIQKSISLCEYYSQYAWAQLAPSNIIEEDLEATIVYEPLGVILGIMPWNFPVWQTLRFCIPTILSGNVVVLKPALNVGQSSHLLQELFEKVFKEFKVFQLLIIEVDQVSEVIKHQAVKGVSITGSARAGSSVASIAGAYIKKSVLELGGSDPYVVYKDADVISAARYAVKSRMNNSGQTCIAAKRIIIHEAVYDQFLEAFTSKLESLVLGNPLDEATNIGPLARKDLREQLQRQVDSSIEKGAKIIVDGGIVNGPGNFFKPMVLTNVTPGMPVYDEELFGPVAVLIPFKSIEEAVQISNNTVYGLGACIWSASKDIIDYYTKHTEAGYIAVNSFVTSDPRLPFGGIKNSGYGRELGVEGIREFTNLKTINHNKV